MEAKRNRSGEPGSGTRGQKAERTNTEARSLIDAESRARVVKTAKLKALRLAKEAAESEAKANQPIATNKRRAKASPPA